MPDFFTLLSCLCPQGGRHSVLIQVHREKRVGSMKQGRMYRAASSIHTKDSGEFCQWLPSYHSPNWWKCSCAVTFWAKQILTQFFFSGVSEEIFGAFAISCCFLILVGNTVLVLYPDRPLQGILYGKERCWSCGQRKPPLLRCIKNPIQKLRRDFSWTIMTGICTVVCFLPQIIILLC